MLPDGLKMNWRNGTISGTPTQSLDNTTYTVTVTALGVTTTGFGLALLHHRWPAAHRSRTSLAATGPPSPGPASLPTTTLSEPRHLAGHQSNLTSGFHFETTNRQQLGR